MSRRYATPWARAIGVRIAAWGWTQKQMADYLDEAPARITDWLQGKYEPSDNVKPKLISRLMLSRREVEPKWLELAREDDFLPGAPPCSGTDKVAS